MNGRRTAAVVAACFITAGCGSGSYSGRNTPPSESGWTQIRTPDSVIEFTCRDGDGIYVSSVNGGDTIAVVASDPACKAPS